MVIKFCEGIPCSSFYVKELYIVCHFPCIALLNFWPFCTPTHKRTWWLRWGLGIVSRSYYGHTNLQPHEHLFGSSSIVVTHPAWCVKYSVLSDGIGFKNEILGLSHQYIFNATRYAKIDEASYTKSWWVRECSNGRLCARLTKFRRAIGHAKIVYLTHDQKMRIHNNYYMTY